MKTKMLKLSFGLSIIPLLIGVFILPVGVYAAPYEIGVKYELDPKMDPNAPKPNYDLNIIDQGHYYQPDPPQPVSAPVLAEVVSITTPSAVTSPYYTFYSDQEGKVTYGGDCSSNTINAIAGNNTINFKTLSPGTYSNCTIKVTNSANKTSSPLSISQFTISAPQIIKDTPDSSSSDTPDAKIPGEILPAPEIMLNTSPDILTCKKRADTLYFENDQPAYDYLGVDCILRQPATVTAAIYNSNYDVKSSDNSGNLIRTIQLSKGQAKGRSYFGWDGYDDYDQPAELADYNFVIEATLNATYKPDISLQKFKIANPPVAETPEEKAAVSSDTDATSVSTSTTDGLHESATPPNVPKEPSKCPGTFYPTDIVGAQFENTIKNAYDQCLVKGYEDGTFRPEQGLTRAEATKIVVLASGHIAKQGCYDADCGSPFMDLDLWQGPWVRAAWDLKMVSGVGADRFAPNREITRAEAAALIVKSFQIPPYQGCYTPNCGAGHPDNFFNDIKLAWEGQYLRALWDKKVISADSSGKFFPDIPVMRGEVLDWIFKVKGGATVTSGSAATTSAGQSPQ